MAQHYNRAVGLSVEGMGDSVASANGIAWYIGRQTIGTPGDYEWVGGTGSGRGIVKPPQSVAASVNPWQCTARGSSYSFQIKATDRAKSLWLHRPAAPVDSLNATTSDNATTIAFSGNKTWSASDDGTAVWVADEVILLGSYVSGSTFSGSTRGLWNTKAVLHPAKLNVYDKNPRRIDRVARLLVYDHDAATISQAWLGFITDISIDGPIINVRAIDLLAATKNATVGRGKFRDIRTASALVAHARDGSVTGSVGLGNSQPPRRRVNKRDAAVPHWLAVQAEGAVFYANYSSPFADMLDVDAADESAGSLPALGGSTSDIDFRDAPAQRLGRRMFELLVVDRLRDTSAGAEESTYANVRSSTRDLKYPFSPVAIGMALLTSGNDHTPGVAGSGAAGSFAFGTTVTDLGWEELLLGATGAAQHCAAGNPDATGWVINNNLANTQYPTKIGPSDGLEDWEAAHLDATFARNSYSIIVVDGVVYTWVDRGAAPDYTVVALNWADGTLVWATTDQGGGANGSIQYDATNDEIIACGVAGPEIVLDPSPASPPTADIIDTVVVSGSQDGKGCVHGGAFVACWGADLRAHDIPFRDPETQNWSIAISTYTGGGGADNNNVVMPCPAKLASSAAGEDCVLLMTNNAGADVISIIQVSDGTEAGTIDVSANANGTTSMILEDMWLDKNDHIYVLKTSTDGDVSEWQRYDDGGSFVLRQAITGTNWDGSDDAQRGAVDGDGNVLVINDIGYGKGYSQT